MALTPELSRILPLLRCPRSGAGLEPEPLAAGAALRSPAGRWPVVEGIAVFREGPETHRALALLEAGDEPGAAAVLAAPALRSRADRIRERFEQWVLRRPPGGPAARRVARRLEAEGRRTFRDAVSALFGRPPWPEPKTATYFLRRRSDPSFVAAEALVLSAAPRLGPFLDAGCGVGHLLTSLAGGEREPLVGMDALFPALLLARRFLAPSAALVCNDDPGALPFADGAFAGVACVDAFFDFPSLPAAAAEMRRVLRHDGVALLPHLHNREVAHLYAGRCPLTPAEYLDVLAPLAPSLLDERAVAAAAVGADPYELRPTRDHARLAGAADLVALGGAFPEVLAGPGPILPAVAGPWRVNPVYRESARQDGEILLARDGIAYISEEESGPFEGLLPGLATGPESVFDRLPAPELPPELTPLAASRVLLPFPPALVPEAGVPSAPAPPSPRPNRDGAVRLARDVRSALRAAGLARRLALDALEAFPGGALAILMGHRVTDGREPDPLDLSVPARVLDRTLATLRSELDLLPFEDALEALLAGTLPPGLSLTLTFDDGTEDLARHGAAVLERHGVSAGVFLSGPEAAPGGRFWWDATGAGGRRADASAFLHRESVWVVGHHGRGHRALEKLTEAERLHELGPLPFPTGPWLAYPFGRPGDAGRGAAVAARDAGFRAAFTTRPGLALPGDEPHLLPRVALHDAPADGLVLRLRGLVRRERGRT